MLIAKSGVKTEVYMYISIQRPRAPFSHSSVRAPTFGVRKKINNAWWETERLNGKCLLSAPKPRSSQTLAAKHTKLGGALQKMETRKKRHQISDYWYHHQIRHLQIAAI